MLASLSNKIRMNGRRSLLFLIIMVGAAGCSDPEIDRPGTWKPTGINDQNLRAMLVNPQDRYSGTGAMTSRGDNGSRAVTRLLADKRRALLDASASRLAPSSSAADSGPGPTAGGGSSGGAP